MIYSDEFKNFVATIAGEAGGCSSVAWKVVAHCIMNRIGFGEWVNARNVSDILKKNFDAITDGNPPFKKAIYEMNNGNISSHTQDIIDAVYSIYYKTEEDITNGVVLYYSPKAQAALHAKNPQKYKSLIPDFAKSHLTEEVKIKGTENDDMRWYRYKGTSRFYTKFIDTSAQALVKASININYKKTKNVPSLSNLISDNKGMIRSFLVQDGWGARFSVDGVSVKDEQGKELMLIADGKNHTAVIVVNNGKGGIQSRTDIHNQQPAVSQPQKDKTSESSSQEESKDNSNNNTEKSDVSFNIKMIDSDNKPIPNMAYFLKYKGNDKKHTVGADGIDRNIIAESGQTLSVEISGKDTRQVIKSFTASNGISEQIIKFELHRFEILFRHTETKKAISYLNLIQTYRGRTSDKKTNSEGKILVNAMPGFELNYKLRDGRNLLTIKVDKNKEIRIIDVDSNAIEQATKNLKADTQLPKKESQGDRIESSAPKQEVKSEDQTSKRDKTTSTSSDGHPKTVVNDSGEAEFTVLTYDEKINQLFSGGSYIIEYKGNKRTHVSGTHGLGKKVHKGTINEAIKIIVLESNKERVIFDGKIEKNMKTIELKIKKIEVISVEGVQVLFSGVNEEWRQTIVSEKTKKVLAYLAKEAGMNKIYITSTIRTPEAQANAMYNQNIKYMPPGEAVKAVRDTCKAQKMSKEQTIKKMVEKIIELQDKNQVVSRHCVSKVSYNKRNVVDIGLNSNGFGSNTKLSILGEEFKKACNEAKDKGIISGFISGDTPGEGAMHIEIVQ